MTLALNPRTYTKHDAKERIDAQVKQNKGRIGGVRLRRKSPGCDYDETIMLGYAPQEKDKEDCTLYYDELFELTQEVPKRSSLTLLTDNNGTMSQEGEEQLGYEVDTWRVCEEGGEGHTKAMVQHY